MKTCRKEEVEKKWKGLCLPMDQFEALLSLGGFSSDIDWMGFFALGRSALGGVRCYIRPNINANTTSYLFLWALKPTVRQRTAGDPQAALFLFIISWSSLLVFILDPDVHDPDFSIRAPRLQWEWLDKSFFDNLNLCSAMKRMIFALKLQMETDQREFLLALRTLQMMA